MLVSSFLDLKGPKWTKNMIIYLQKFVKPPGVHKKEFPQKLHLKRLEPIMNSLEETN